MARSSTSYRKGQSGNARGRPKGAWGRRRRLLTEYAAQIGEGATSDQVVRLLIRRAREGDWRASRFLTAELQRR